MKKIIFDLDDTLYINENLKNLREKAILNFFGDKKEEFLKLKAKNFGTIESFKILGSNREKFFELMNNIKIELEKDEILINILKKFKDKYKIIIVSNSSRHCIEETLNKLGIFELIDRYYGGDDFNNSKPNSECFFMVEKGDICIGNSFKKDLEIPKKLGAITILIGDNLLNKSPDVNYIIKHIHELENIILKNGL